MIEDLRTRFPVKLLAEKVETYQEFKSAKEMGFDYFQGYFFAKPEVLSSKGISVNHVTKLKLINEIGNRKLNINNIQALIKNDAPLSFKLLKYANSAFFRRRIPIDTIKDAVNYIGEDELRKFINVVVVSDLGRTKPNELVRLSIIRARMCEHFKSIFQSKFSGEELFTLGLFSNMDAIMDCPMNAVLSHLSFSDKMKLALMGRDKEFTLMLDVISGFERGSWDTPVYKRLAGTAVEKKLPLLYADAIKMANAFYA